MAKIVKPKNCQFGAPVRKIPEDPPDPAPEPDPISEEDAELWALPQYGPCGEGIEDYVVSLRVIKRTMANLKAKRDAVVIPDEPVEPELTEDNMDTYNAEMNEYEEDIAERDRAIEKRTMYDGIYKSYNYVAKTIAATPKPIENPVGR